MDSRTQENSPDEMEKNEAIQRLKERMLKVTPLPDEPEYATSEETIVRFLKAWEWKEEDAEKGLLETIEYRRQNAPLRTQCRWCHGRPGYHSMRQVGHDESGRPVVYANFAQATAQKNSLEDIMNHVTFLIENAKVTMQPGVSTWVFLIDCSGMTLSVCSPKVGLRVVNLLSAHYPERLGLIICVNHNPIFHAFWKAIKKFLAPSTASKMRLIRSESKIRHAFSTYFPEDLASWMWDEITINKTKPLKNSQKQFWLSSPEESVHDPRGCPSYVENYVNKFSPSYLEYVPGERKMHCPHPNICVIPDSNLETTILPENNHLEDAAASVELHDNSSGLIDEVPDELVLENGGHSSEGDDENSDDEINHRDI